MTDLIRSDLEPVLFELFTRSFPTAAKTMMAHPAEPWPFGSVLERPLNFHRDPAKVMHIATWDEHHIEIIYLDGPHTGERERVNPLDWRLVT